jgi:hypothetical protein
MDLYILAVFLVYSGTIYAGLISELWEIES